MPVIEPKDDAFYVFRLFDNFFFFAFWHTPLLFMQLKGEMSGLIRLTNHLNSRRSGKKKKPLKQSDTEIVYYRNCILNRYPSILCGELMNTTVETAPMLNFLKQICEKLQSLTPNAG